MADNNNTNEPLSYDTRKRYEKARIEKVKMKKAVPANKKAIHPLKTATAKANCLTAASKRFKKAGSKVE
jgi:hypothetical protein